METRTVKKSINIHASSSEVWNAITDPATVEKYFFGTHVESDWKKGHSIIYSGIWKGKEYRDEGEILEIEKGKKLVHTHRSGMSELSDKPASTFTVTYELEPDGENTMVIISQVGEMSSDTFDHSAQNWQTVLEKMKELLERVPAT